ncbi:hypothetical protein F0U62_43455 [Cystobacter fuscus]|uniref:hypothetical protein n=1 Tax=Cystobacter fuscus TaxID=43 RepID=UPI002B27E185|nr:hypothetical protein F0U62_43455 [Cystobacter fuscus]
MKRERLPWALGWASLGIGLTELAFAEGICRVLGLSKYRADRVRALGLRELASGWGLLREPQRRDWVWARVAGDAMDLTLLAVTFGKPRASRVWQGVITAAVAGVTLVDLYAALRPGAPLARSAAPSLGKDVGRGVPAESWRGSGLAEDMGVNGSRGEEGESEEVRQRMMDEAAKRLGLPEVKEPGVSH